MDISYTYCRKKENDIGNRVVIDFRKIIQKDAFDIMKLVFDRVTLFDFNIAGLHYDVESDHLSFTLKCSYETGNMATLAGYNQLLINEMAIIDNVDNLVNSIANDIAGYFNSKQLIAGKHRFYSSSVERKWNEEDKSASKA